MGSWTAITLQLRGEDDYWNEHNTHVTHDASDLVETHLDHWQYSVLKARTVTDDGDTIPYIGIELEYLSSHEIKQKLTHFNEVATRAVVITANNTSDTGTAYLYEHGDRSWIVQDEYEEDQTFDGVQAGTKAASVMHVAHNIPAIGRFERLRR